MNVDAVSNERVRSFRCALRHMRHATEVHMSADDSRWSLAHCRAEAARREGERSHRLRADRPPKRVARERSGDVGFSEQREVVTGLGNAINQLAAERRNTTAEPIECRGPDVNSQETVRARVFGTAYWRSLGFGHLCHAHPHASPAATAAPPPPRISTIDPFG